MKRKVIGLDLLLVLLLAGPAAAQTFFTEVAEEAIVGHLFSARSTTFGDYDNDGWPDLFLTVHFDSQVALYHNEGNGRFTDPTIAIQDSLTPKWKGGGSIFGDYDNDGDLDLYVPVGSFSFAQADQNVLLRNDRGVFRDVTLEAGLTDSLPTDNAIWLDYDRDGHLDIYNGNLAGNPADPTVRNKLYRNNGDGTFADVTLAAGLDIQLSRNGGSNGGIGAGDFDGDGWPDLYVGVFEDRNRLFLNDGKGGFQDATTGEIGDPGQAFGVAVGDIDNDGDLEIFQAAGGGSGLQRSLMLLNVGQGQFLDITDAVGLSGLFGKAVGGAVLGDLDNDGDLDLLTGNPHFLFSNDGNGLFEDRTALSGIGVNAWSLSLGDYDLDGFLDVVMGGTTSAWRLYHNNGNDNHWLRVELVGTKSNRSGIGARLIATSGELRQIREILGGLGYYQDELVAHFGLGPRTRVDRLEIRWPSGQVEVLTDIPADQKIRIIEGGGEYFPIQPATWKALSLDTLVVGQQVHAVIAVQPALFERGARITEVVADLSAVGGPVEVSLVQKGETYALESAFAVKGPNGWKELKVSVEQTTSVGAYWTQISRQIAVFPAADLRILDEGLGAGWQAAGARGAEILNLRQTETVFQGALAGAFQVKPTTSTNLWSVEFRPETPVDTLGFTALRFAFNPGDTRGRLADLANLVQVRIGKGRSVLLNPPGYQNDYVALERQEWQEVEIPLAMFALQGSIESITFFGNLEGRFYLDDLRLVAATPSSLTAVEEERTAALPQPFSLSQNYPNPFNSQTVIHFELPQSGEVELAVFNLVGQEVMKLVKGVREAGTYTVRWDGRDAQGRGLASGVYLYRLRTREQEKTRKLTLVR